MQQGDPEAESPKATHHQHVHVEQHDDANTLPTQAQVIIKREQLSKPSDFSKAKHATNMKHPTARATQRATGLLQEQTCNMHTIGREGGRVTIGPRAQSK